MIVLLAGIDKWWLSLFATVFFLFSEYSSAQEIKLQLPLDRSLASIQEEQFDQMLDRYRMCYGVHLSYKDASEGRRRACKAVLLHKLSSALEQPGSYFSVPLRFECQNTAAGFTKWYEWNSAPVLKLKPNQEYEAIDLAIQQYYKKSNKVNVWLRAQKVCDFLIQCKSGFGLEKINFTYLRRCFFNIGGVSLKEAIQRELLSGIFNKNTNELIIRKYLEEESSGI